MVEVVVCWFGSLVDEKRGLIVLMILVSGRT